MKLVDKIHVEGFIDNDYEEFGFVEENYRSGGSMYITVDARVVTKLLSELNEKAEALINDKETEYECGDMRDVTLDNVGFQLFFTEDKTTLEQAQEYLILDTFGGLSGEEGWFGYSEWSIEGVLYRNF